MSDRLNDAIHFAVEAHRRIEHRRKYSGASYDAHLRAVAEIVDTVTDDPEILAAAWLHDTVEDTPATFKDVEDEFGPRVARLVQELTDVSRPSDGNRATRKAIDLEHLALGSPDAQTIKLADLIDNCEDITRHDPEFARVYLGEAAALLEVLVGGDARLLERARRVHARCSKQIGLEVEASGSADWSEDVSPLGELNRHGGLVSLFTRGFTARDVAATLHSFDSSGLGPSVSESMSRQGLDVAGVREDGLVRAYVYAGDLQGADEQATPRPLARDQVLPGEAPLADVIQALTRHEHCFVTSLGAVDGVISRAEIQTPVVRMWLFGIITIIEMDIVERLRASWPDGGWADRLSPARRAKAETLLEERRRRGQNCDLLDCLQISEKAQILISDPAQLARLGFSSKRVARRVIGEFESLRNNLAHSQDIVTHDWSQIARLARRIQQLAADSG